MGDWIHRIRKSAALEDGSLLFQAAAQAMAAIDRSRDRWGERGTPFWLREDGPAPESEWVWLGAVLRETCTGRTDLDNRPGLLAFRIREETPLDAAMRVDRFRGAWTLPPDHDVRWLEPSGEPYLSRAAEALLEHAFDGWERELEWRWQTTPDPERRGLFHRKRRALRRKREGLYRAINQERLTRFIRLIDAAYAPDAAFEARLARLEQAERRAVVAAVATERPHLVAAAGPGAGGAGSAGEGRAAG